MFMNICLFSETEVTEPLSFEDERAQHIIKILHKKEGDTFYAGVIGGKSGNALITKIESWEERSASGKVFTAGKIHFTFKPEKDGLPLNKLCVILGFPRPIQLKRILRDMAGLGVCGIHLVKTELGEKSYTESDLSSPENCRRLLIEGCMQAASTNIPEIFFHGDLKSCLDFLNLNPAEKKESDSSLRVALDNQKSETSLIELIQGGIDIGDSMCFAAIGSERGWTDNERSIFKEYGFCLAKMGSRIMRTETAATVAASILISSIDTEGSTWV